MTNISNVKHRFVGRVLKSTLAAAFATSLIGCGGGNLAADAGSTLSLFAPTITRVSARPITWIIPGCGAYPFTGCRFLRR